MTLLLAVSLLGAGFALGRCYQWGRQLLTIAHVVPDPSAAARSAVSDIAARTRRAEEQIRRASYQGPRPR